VSESGLDSDEEQDRGTDRMWQGDRQSVAQAGQARSAALGGGREAERKN
jgi:hypothetical protein